MRTFFTICTGQLVALLGSQLTVDPAQLGEYIGSLSQQRMKQILTGKRFLQLMTERPKQVK